MIGKLFRRPSLQQLRRWRSMTHAALSLTMLGAVVWGTSCRYDPVPQQAIDKLPSEEPDGGPSELHRQGQPCVLCHSEYEGADPPMAVGGTVYREDLERYVLEPVEGVFVTIYDSAGASQKACTNSSGNFYVRLDDWPDAKFPFTVQVGNRFMRSLVGRDRSCAGCHMIPSRSRVENDPTVDPLTGAGRDSAGAILVDPATVPPEQQCGPNPASSSGAGGSGAGTGGSGAGTGGMGSGGDMSGSGGAGGGS